MKNIWEKNNKVTDGGLTEKKWILPNGDIEELGSEFHYSYLLNNKKISKKYKIDLSTVSENQIRVNALKSGLFRVNHEKRSGIIVFEGCQKHFNKQVKDTIFEIIAYSKLMMNTIKINLYNDDVTSLKKTGSVNVGIYDKMERVEHIPFITESRKLRDIYEDTIIQ